MVSYRQAPWTHGRNDGFAYRSDLVHNWLSLLAAAGCKQRIAAQAHTARARSSGRMKMTVRLFVACLVVVVLSGCGSALRTLTDNSAILVGAEPMAVTR